jgi:hypothetical protein
MNALQPWKRLCAGLSLSLLASLAVAQTSTDLIIESVSDYGPNDQLPNAVPNGDGFAKGMLFAGSRFTPGARYTNGAVYDTDFADTTVEPRGNDATYFDRRNRAIAFFTGHGIPDHGCSTMSCATSATCTKPATATGGGIPRLPGVCRFSPFDTPRCCYMVDRQAVTNSVADKLNGLINYTGGPIRWGESPQSGGWAGAGTDGGANLVVLDISHGVLPPFWAETFLRANAGVQLIATMMTAGGDTASVPDRGAVFASFFRANENSRVAEAWVQTMNSLPASEGGGCPGGGGGHGFNGCGCNIVIGMDISAARANASLTESWVHLTQDSNDALGRNFFAARWVCNYPIKPGRAAWVLP